MKLFEKGKIGKLQLKNRVVMGPMGMSGEADGSYDMNNIYYFQERAKGGVGLIITGANIISTKYEDRFSTELSNFHHVQRLAELVERCHHYGAKVAVQLSPGIGRIAFTDPFTPPYSASENQAFWFPNLKCKPLCVEDIKYLVERFGYSATLVAASGADAIELHAYGGYLLDQFHTTMWNSRTDEYGGDLRSRMRFTLECIAAMRASVGPDFPIIVKFTPFHGVPGGRELSEGLEMAEILEEAGVDALHVDVGCYEAWYRAMTTVYSKPAHQIEITEAVKKAVNIPVMGMGKLDSPDVAEDVLEKEKCDFVILAHQMLTDPHWPRKVKNGELYDIVPCIGCNECLYAGLFGKRCYCAVNPLCLAENEYQLTPLQEKRKVLVIGGGPGGMEAAITAAQRGCEVELWEKSDRLGGLLQAAGGPDFKASVRRYMEYLINKVLSSGVKVSFLTDVSPEEVLAAGFDKIIIATGSTPIIPKIPGIENAAEATAVLQGKVKTGKKCVVIGGGLVGCETAAMLAEEADVTVLEMLPNILMTALEAANNTQALSEMIKERNITVCSGAKVTNIKEGKVIYEKDGSVCEVSADTIVIAAGFKPNNSLAEALEDKADVSIVGDALRPRKVINAVHEAYHAIRIME